MKICWFCGKKEGYVDVLFFGIYPAIRICNECVGLCVKSLEERKERNSAKEIYNTAFSEFYGTD